MCGIAGIYRFRGEGDDAAVVERMLGCLKRRGPDDQGLFANARVTLGHRRLSIIDLSPAGHQPMTTSDGRYVLTYNGEIFNFKDVRRELGGDALHTRSTSDAEILLLAWQRWGEGALTRILGQWAFAVVDTRESRMWLVRDRFGQKPLYHHTNAERLVFASSLESLMRAPGTSRELDLGALTEYVTLRYVVAPRTVIREARKLPPGHLIELGPSGVVSERCWYRPRFRAVPRSASETGEQFGELFTRACERCLVSDVPVALLLSDGIDSNAVRAALVARGEAPPSFTFRVRDHESGTHPAPATGEGGEVLDVRVSAAERLEKMSACFTSLTEPVGDGASLATWMLIRAARPRATVFLCGHGGDEVLGGYRLSQDRFRIAALRQLAALPNSWLRGPMERYLYGDEPLATRRAALLEARPAEAPAAARYLVDRPLPASQVRALSGGALPEGEAYLGTIDRLYGECEASETDLDRMQRVLLATFLSANILSFADSVSMDASAELRMPFLDRDLAEFSFSLPASARVSRWPGRANTKSVLRHWAKGRVPEDIVKRRKRGFQSGNISELMRHDRAELFRFVLDARALRRALPGAEAWITALPAEYGGPWGGTLWSLVALGAWCEGLGVT